MRALGIVCLALAFTPAVAQVGIKGRIVHTVAGPAIKDGVVLVENGKIKAIGPASSINIPSGWKTLEAAVVTPGLIDAHGTVGLSGLLNGKDQAHDQEQLEGSSPIQPELRAIDAYNPLDPLVPYLRSFGVTTVHTGHAPGETVSGGTIVVKLHGTTVEEALVRADAAVAATLGPGSLKGEKSPGTRGKQMAMLRADLLKAQEYVAKLAKAKPEEPVSRDLKLDVWAKVLKGETPLMITAQRAQDIDTALRLAQEFKLKLWLDGAAESYLLADALKQASVPVIARASMMRAVGEQANATVELPALLRSKGVFITMGSGYEGYVPKTRVILFEAALAAANGLGFDDALAMITRDAAQLLGIADRVGTLQPGKDADIALFDGDPFEYTSHCVGTLIDGKLEFEGQR
ncbi:MAG: amidohydrolase family protein [Acidobacteriota bacterium]